MAGKKKSSAKEPVEMKYELVDDEKSPTLKRVKALKGFGDVTVGDFGGLVDSEECLSQEGLCWIDKDSIVQGGSTVTDDAVVRGSVLMDSNVGGGSLVTGSNLCGATLIDSRVSFCNVACSTLKGADIRHSNIAGGHTVFCNPTIKG